METRNSVFRDILFVPDGVDCLTRCLANSLFLSCQSVVSWDSLTGIWVLSFMIYFVFQRRKALVIILCTFDYAFPCWHMYLFNYIVVVWVPKTVGLICSARWAHWKCWCWWVMLIFCMILSFCSFEIAFSPRYPPFLDSFDWHLPVAGLHDFSRPPLVAAYTVFAPKPVPSQVLIVKT